MKNTNSYYLGLGILIILLQLFYPPHIKGSLSYILFVIGVLIVNGGFILLKSIFRRKENGIIEIFNKPNLTFLVFLSQAVGVSSFSYFFYLHFVVFADSRDSIIGEYTEEYVYRGESFFITPDAYEAMKFWELSIFILIPLGLIISIISNFKRKKAIKSTEN